EAASSQRLVAVGDRRRDADDRIAAGRCGERACGDEARAAGASLSVHELRHGRAPARRRVRQAARARGGRGAGACYAFQMTGPVRRYFEEIAIGETYESPGRTVNETDLVLFAGVSGYYNHLSHGAGFMKSCTFA